MMLDAPRGDLWVALTVDTDADEYFGDRAPARPPGDKTITGWRGLEQGKDVLAEAAHAALDSYGQPAPLTWFVRCDGQVRAVLGDEAWLLDAFADWWSRRRAAGDDIQWHAHLYRQAGDRWVQETDLAGLTGQLEGSVAAWRLAMAGAAPRVVRIGEAYHGNGLMAFLDDAGLQADSTAMPGRRRVDDEKTIDWVAAPNRPYHPSVADYRAEGRPARAIWEVPMNTVTTRVAYDRAPLARYVSLGFQPGVLDAGLHAFVRDHDVLVSVTHPFELLAEFYRDSRTDGHPLLAFVPAAASANVRAILRAAEEAGRKVRFVTISALLDGLEAGHVGTNG